MSENDKSWCTLRHLYNLVDLLVILRTTRINIPKFFLMYTHCIYVFCVDLRADSIDHELTFITETECVYCSVRAESFICCI
jgi:hypothetical protein